MFTFYRIRQDDDDNNNIIIYVVSSTRSNFGRFLARETAVGINKYHIKKNIRRRSGLGQFDAITNRSCCRVFMSFPACLPSIGSPEIRVIKINLVTAHIIGINIEYSYT